MSWLDSDKLNKLADALGGEGDENQSFEEDSVTYGAETAEVEADDDAGAGEEDSNDGESSDTQDEETVETAEQDDGSKDAGLSKRAQKRIQKLLSSRNDATRRAKELETRLAELESKMASKATEQPSNDEESDEDFLKRIYGEEDDGQSDPRYSELQRSYELQQSQLNEILVERERNALRHDIELAEEAHPDLPDLRQVLINAVVKDGTVDVLDLAEQYANMVAKIRGSGQTAPKADAKADNSGPRAVPRPVAKGTKPSSGLRQTNQAPVRDWKTAHQSFMDAIKD